MGGAESLRILHRDLTNAWPDQETLKSVQMLFILNIS